MRVTYRVRQFWDTLTAVPEVKELASVQTMLSSPLMALFSTLSPSEQAHSLGIYRQLIDRGETHPDLLVAALLHDVGKSRHPLRLWERVVIVLAKALFPARAKRWGHGQPQGWRRPFVVAEQHPAWGAEMAARAGASPLAAALIARHQDPTATQGPRSLEDHLLLRLQEFDNQN